jgi:hypothetical protein
MDTARGVFHSILLSIVVFSAVIGAFARETLGADSGIREEIPARYRARFEKWKTELLTTEFGRTQWETYARDTQFVLTIRITEDRGKGAGTDKFQWDGDGRLTGATITLGADLDGGVPPPTYYPVLNALSPELGVPAIHPSVIAAAKLSHEIGHVEQAGRMTSGSLQLESRLVPKYVEIFLHNGLDPNDNRLLALRDQLGGTPTELWQDREFNSEVVALRYLAERLASDDICRVLRKVRGNLNEYGQTFESRFDLDKEFASRSCKE